MEKFDIGMWLTTVLWPALLALLGFQIKTRSSLFREIGAVKDQVSNHRLHVAEDYVSQASLKDTEERILRHLGRIEQNLDALANQHKEGR